eukprot:TRINITY_DN72204_c0_g1_i3.p1 TRINITY_DN72204_c0_g1~~TRINITY_DN72204_c0_g1_i3.p1  ORF type:complete len:1003 (-),score=132.39 TRINITY_DN72204_c0_g1_i3:17-3025(-)
METPRFEIGQNVPADTWSNVDELELQRIAIKLATGGTDPNAQDSEKERVRSTNFAAHHTDPLGLGRLNPRTLRLLRSESDEGIRNVLEVPQQKQIKHQEILLTMDGFDPYKFLVHVHSDSSLDELQNGVKNLQSELQQQTGELKQLVKENFERFISCKSTIDDVHSKLVAGEDSHEGKGGTSGVLANHVREVRLSALDAFGPIIQRHVESLRVRNVVNLLDRFHYLFQIPANVRKHAEEGDYEGVVSQYANGKKVLKEADDTIWESLLHDLENVIRDEIEKWIEQLRETDIDTKLATNLVVNLIALKKLGAATLENISPLTIFIETQKSGVEGSIAVALSKLENAKESAGNKSLLSTTFSKTLSRNFSRQLSLFGSQQQLNGELQSSANGDPQYEVQFVKDILSSLQSWVPKVFVVCRAAKQQGTGEDVICKMFEMCCQHISSSLKEILGQDEDSLFFGRSKEVVDALLHFFDVAHNQADKFPEKLQAQLTDFLEKVIVDCVQNYAHRLPRISTLLSSDEQVQATKTAGCLKQLRSGSLLGRKDPQNQQPTTKVLQSLHLCINDAQLISDKLQEIDFQVTQVYNSTTEGLKQQFRAFGSKLQHGDVVIVYIAGHGGEINGENYIFGTDAQGEAVDGVTPLSGVNLQKEALKLLANKNKQCIFLILLDVCRVAPAKDQTYRSRSATAKIPTESEEARKAKLLKELTPEDLEEMKGLGRQTQIVYACQPGKISLEKEGAKNGFFASAFSDCLDSNLAWEEIVVQTMAKVHELSGGIQRPETISGLRTRLQLVKTDNQNLQLKSTEIRHDIGNSSSTYCDISNNPKTSFSRLSSQASTSSSSQTKRLSSLTSNKILKAIKIVATSDSKPPEGVIKVANPVPGIDSKQDADVNKFCLNNYVWLIPEWTTWDEKDDCPTAFVVEKYTQKKFEEQDLTDGVGDYYRYLIPIIEQDQPKRIVDVGLWRIAPNGPTPKYQKLTDGPNDRERPWATHKRQQTAKQREGARK